MRRRRMTFAARRDIAMIQAAFEREGAMNDNGQCVVPGDFFDRLNTQLNPPQPSVLDMLLDQKPDTPTN